HRQNVRAHRARAVLAVGPRTSVVNVRAAPAEAKRYRRPRDGHSSNDYASRRGPCLRYRSRHPSGGPLPPTEGRRPRTRSGPVSSDHEPRTEASRLVRPRVAGPVPGTDRGPVWGASRRRDGRGRSGGAGDRERGRAHRRRLAGRPPTGVGRDVGPGTHPPPHFRAGGVFHPQRKSRSGAAALLPRRTELPPRIRGGAPDREAHLDRRTRRGDGPNPARARGIPWRGPRGRRGRPRRWIVASPCRRASRRRSPRATPLCAGGTERERERVRSPLRPRRPRNPTGDRFPVGPIFRAEPRFEGAFLVSDEEVRGNPEEENKEDGSRRADDQSDPEHREEVRSRDRVAGPRIGPGGDESARGQARVRGAAGSREEREAPTE